MYIFINHSLLSDASMATNILYNYHFTYTLISLDIKRHKYCLFICKFLVTSLNIFYTA